MTASWVCRSYVKTMATAEWGLPVFRPAWTSSKNVWPRSPPHPRLYSGSGSRKTARARRPGLRRSPQQWLHGPVGWVRCGRTPQRHHLRTGTNPQLVPTPSEHRRRHSSQRRKSFWGLIRPAPNADPSPTLTCASGPARNGPGRARPSTRAAVSAARPVRRRLDDSARPSHACRLQRHRRPCPRVATPFSRSQGLRTHRTDGSCDMRSHALSEYVEGGQRMLMT